jgi:hypothetical protein
MPKHCFSDPTSRPKFETLSPSTSFRVTIISQRSHWITYSAGIAEFETARKPSLMTGKWVEGLGCKTARILVDGEDVILMSDRFRARTSNHRKPAISHIMIYLVIQNLKSERFYILVHEQSFRKCCRSWSPECKIPFVKRAHGSSYLNGSQ